MRMSEIFDLLEEGRVKDAMNVIKRQDRIRKDDIRLWQALVNSLDNIVKQEGLINDWGIAEEMLGRIFYLEDREFLKLIFENES